VRLIHHYYRVWWPAVGIEGVFDMTSAPAVHQAGMNTASEARGAGARCAGRGRVVDLFGDGVRESGHELGTLGHRGFAAA
jgi:hypothetical protein